MTNPVPESIPVEIAAKWIGRWQLSNRTLKAVSFTFGVDEFQALLNEENVDRVRLYLALDQQNDGTINEKLLVVGVDKNGNDVTNPTATPPPGQKSVPGGDGSGIYDFSHPCPPICG